MVVGAETTDEDAHHPVQIERPHFGHRLQVGPVLGAVEERLEDGEVGAGEEGQAVAAEVLPPDAAAASSWKRWC